MARQFKVPKGKDLDSIFAKSGGGAGGKYPWDEWLNGECLLLEKDELNGDGTVQHKKDFDVEVDAMPAKIKTAARRRYKTVQISRRDADGKKLENGLIIRAKDMTAEERAAEDVLRAEEKDANKERREKEKTLPTPATA